MPSHRTRSELLFVSGTSGTGGAGVATVNDAHATYWNPAALGYLDGWSVMLPFSVSASSEGDAIGTLDFVMGISVRKGGFVFDFAGGSSFSTAEVEDVTMPERLNFALNLRYEKRF
jgi:hypothetical protein